MTALFDLVLVPKENQPSADQKRQRQPRFWIGPVVAGSCFALGFGVTQRLVALQGGEAPSGEQFFGAQRFPGDSLDSLSMGRQQSARPLMADVAAREAELAKTRPPKPKKDADKARQEAARLAKEARLRRERMAAVAAPVVPAAAVTVLEEPLLMPAPELPPHGESDGVATFDPQPLPAAVVLPEPAPLMPVAAEPVRDPVVTPRQPRLQPSSILAPAPLTVPAPVVPPMP
jgi:hypothetical protein